MMMMMMTLKMEKKMIKKNKNKKEIDIDIEMKETANDIFKSYESFCKKHKFFKRKSISQYQSI